MKKMVKVMAAAVLFGAMSGSVFQGVGMVSRNIGDSAGTRQESTVKLAATNAAGSKDSGSGDVASIAEQVLPSIVAIDVTTRTTGYTPFGPRTQEGTGSASGIIIAEKGSRMYIATNNHVVEGASDVKILFSDETTAEATVKGTDPATDLAVVEVDLDKLSDETKKKVKIAAIGDSSSVKVGEQAIAIGNALGYGTSVTVGYISAKDREIEDGAGVKLIQTDAAINPGNSGGALVNSKGQVIAINSSKFASEQIEGMGFAIPMATAEPILEKLMNQEKAQAAEAQAGDAGSGIFGRDRA